MRSFSSMPLVHIHLFSYKFMVYRWFYFIMTHATHLGYQRRVHPLGDMACEGGRET